MAVVTPLNNFLGLEGDTVTVDEQLLNTEYGLGWARGCLRRNVYDACSDCVVGFGTNIW